MSGVDVDMAYFFRSEIFSLCDFDPVPELIDIDPPTDYKIEMLESKRS